MRAWGDRSRKHEDDGHGGGRDHAHAHPHAPGSPGAPPRIGFVGAGHVGLGLGIAFSAAGWPVTAVASRDPDRRARFRDAVPGAAAYVEPSAVLDEVDLCFLTVPDDVIASVAAQLRLYSGQALVHTSGARPASDLAPAMAAGTGAGSFHPLLSFAEPQRAASELRGATVALDGDDALVGVLGNLAEAVGARPVRILEGGKGAYHAAAVVASGGLVALLDAIAELARGAGLDEAGALAIYGPLLRGTLANAERIGIAAALSGPFGRGDVGTVEAHLDSMARLAPGAVEVYRALARRELAIAAGQWEREGGGPPTEARAALERLLSGPG